MIRSSCSIVAIFLMSASAFAADAPVSLYGLTLGEPLTIPQCGPSRESMCWVDAPAEIAKIAPPGMQMRQVFFGAQTPRVSRFPFFQVLLTEGVVGDITI